ncbi:MAG: pyridoxal-phosphate dependent enzyme [Spirochaetales bacterium]|nr:pyridoxal-phosphate dependent enzyme [Spirochaetales bacterium]
MFTGIEELKTIQNNLTSWVHYTPVLTSSAFDEAAGCRGYFKCENFQRMGAFKMRGAMNAVLSLTEEERSRGVITHSSGNFAQAVALSARSLNIPATVIMPRNAPIIKRQAVAGYGARIIECDPTIEARVAVTEEESRRTGAVILHPSDQKEVIEGNSSACLELLQEFPSIQMVITPVGGGGLLAGTALAAKAVNPEITVFAGEPAGADDAYRSLKAGKIIPSVNPITIADGLRTQLGDSNFPIIHKLVKKIIRVEEDEIVSAMRFIWERMKIIIEPSAAVAPAAILKSPRLFKGKKVGIILSGGNVDLDNLPF